MPRWKLLVTPCGRSNIRPSPQSRLSARVGPLLEPSGSSTKQPTCWLRSDDLSSRAAQPGIALLTNKTHAVRINFVRESDRDRCSTRRRRREAAIRTRAYYLWETAGRPHGRAEEFWHAAETLMTSAVLGRSTSASESGEKPAARISWASIAAPFNFFASVMWQAFTPRAWSECPS